MTGTQLCLAIGVPVISNVLLITVLIAYINARLSAVDQRLDAINQRFDDMRDLWRTELRRVEDVLDARLKHIEEERRA